MKTNAEIADELERAAEELTKPYIHFVVPSQDLAQIVTALRATPIVTDAMVEAACDALTRSRGGFRSLACMGRRPGRRNARRPHGCHEGSAMIQEQLRSLCPRVVTPRCNPGDAVCIPCEGADRIDALEAVVAALREVYTLGSAAELCEDTVARDIRAIIGDAP
jgi:hypothetical protein